MASDTDTGAAVAEDKPKGGRRRAATDRPEKPAPRTFPFVYVGQMVVWYDHGITGVPSVPAVVTAVGEKAIDLARLHENGPNEMKEAVRYLHEKGVPTAIREESGGWDYTEGDLRLHGLNPKLRAWPDELGGRGDKPAA